MKVRLSLALSLLLLAPLPARAGNGWSTVAYPLTGRPESIGSTSGGCIVGAATLPLVGDGYQAMRVSRNRYYGHPMLIRFVERLGRYAGAQGGRLLVGDLAQPRGGPMPGGHVSHQVGLDADIWFMQPPRGRVLNRQDIEAFGAPSMIVATEGALNHANWSPRYRDTLKQAALSPEVDRIFVNAIIKKALCDSETDRRWLSKVRPWWGHDAHFHVRLACPPDSGQCQSQKPFPPGDGCDPDLNNWVRDIVQAALAPKKPSYKKPRPPSTENLPAACYSVLNSQTAWRQQDSVKPNQAYAPYPASEPPN